MFLSFSFVPKIKREIERERWSHLAKKSECVSMDVYEATRIVLSRIQSLDPANASKIMGLLLLQDHGEKEMIRLAFGPQNLLHSVIAKAKKELGLMSSILNPLPRSGGCVSDDLETDLGFGWGHCSYADCNFVHGGVDETLHGNRIEFNELLRSKSLPPRLAHQFTGGPRFPFSPKGVNLQQQSEAQRLELFIIHAILFFLSS